MALKIFFLQFIVLFWGCLLLLGCKTGHQKLSKEESVSHFQNPVFEPILADPTVIRDRNNGAYYAYGTQDNWGDGKGSRLMPILKSENLTDWEVVGEVFDQKPTWKAQGGLWAPDINFINGMYVLYYSYSTWGDTNPGIGLATAPHPTGPFTDKGKLLDSNDVGVPNSIDPSYFEYNGQKILFWGSFSDGEQQGIHGIELSDDGQKAIDLKQKFKIAAGDWEAAMIHKRGKYFYFFGSKGSCCEGANSKYHVMVARSKNLKGPYYDRMGRPITERGNGTLLLQGDEKVAGPGHHAKIIQDDAGTDWLLYHGILKNNGKVSTGASRRTLMLDKIQWVNGWPEIENQHPHLEKQISPIIKKMQ